MTTLYGNRHEELDLTPRPLKVTKGASRISSTSESSFCTALEAQHKDVPTRRSSLTSRTSSGPLTEALQNQSSPTLDPTTLLVRKQRRGQASTAITTAAEVSGARSSLHLRSPQCGRPSNGPQREARMKSESAPTAMRQLSQRRSGLKKSAPLTMSQNLDLVARSSENRKENKSIHICQLIGSQRRTVTDGGFSSDNDSQSYQKLSSFPSFKNRVLTRFVNSNTPKARLRTAIPEDEIARFKAKPRPLEDSDHTAVRDARHQRRSSFDAVPYTSSSLGNALAAFPPSPSGKVSSRNPLDVVNDSLEVQSNTVRPLSMPQTSSLLTGKLALTPESDEVNFESGESILVAIDFEATVSLEASTMDEWSATTLDIIVIIDNS